MRHRLLKERERHLRELNRWISNAKETMDLQTSLLQIVGHLVTSGWVTDPLEKASRAIRLIRRFTNEPRTVWPALGALFEREMLRDFPEDVRENIRNFIRERVAAHLAAQGPLALIRPRSIRPSVN